MLNIQHAIETLKLIRAPNGITAMTNIVAAATMAFAVYGQSVDLVAIVLLIIASVCLYFSGMALNDICDIKEDSRERPERPLPSGALNKKYAMYLVCALTFAGLMCALAVSVGSFLIALMLSISIVLYDTVLKNGMVGSLVMASCRYINWLLGLSVVPFKSDMLFIPLPILFYIAGLTYLSKQETRADRPDAIYVVMVLLTLSLVSMIWVADLFFQITLLNTIVVVSASMLILYRLLRVFKQFTPEAVQAMIVWMIIGIIPLDALLTFLSGEYIVALLILSLLPLCRFLSTRLAMT